MYKYKPERSLKTKKQYLDSSKEKKFLKTYNLDIDNLTPNMIMHLQSKLGNSATEILLEEMGNLKLTGTGKNTAQINPVSSSQYGNTSRTINKQIIDFTQLSNENGVKVYDAIKKGDFSIHSKKNMGNISLKHGNMDYILRKMCEFVSLLRTRQNKDILKMEEAKEADLLLSNEEKIKRHEVQMILSMMIRLPAYDKKPSVQKQYIKILNFLASSGINLGHFFSLNGDLVSQKQLLLKSIGCKDTVDI